MSKDTATLEGIVSRFAEVLLRAEGEYGAPLFAEDLAERGASPDALQIMASRWIECEFDGPEFADELLALADYIEEARA